MELIWSLCAAHLEIICSLCGAHMELIWSSYGAYVELMWSSYGAQMELIWSLCGAHVELIWSLCGAYVELRWSYNGLDSCNILDSALPKFAAQHDISVPSSQPVTMARSLPWLSTFGKEVNFTKDNRQLNY